MRTYLGGIPGLLALAGIIVAEAGALLASRLSVPLGGPDLYSFCVTALDPSARDWQHGRARG